MSPLRILLVEDDELFRLGLQVRLQQEPGFEIAAQTDDGETALEIIASQPIDIVLLDIGLPGIGGLETCQQLHQRYPHLPILVLTSHSQPTLITQFVIHGAQGYCLKGVAAETLILALRSVAAGASWWDAAATATLRQKLPTLLDTEQTPEVQKLHLHTLTQREQEILALIAAGKSNPEMAKILFITPGTVRVHVHAILHKLGVKDRTQAALVLQQQHPQP